MTASDIEAIVGGYHGDAFRILGPHTIQKRHGQPHWEVRAFLPHAQYAEVLINGRAWPMVRRHKEGFYVAQIEGEQQTYLLRAKLFDGGAVEFDDPYRFPPLLSSFELHLHAEGTHFETYNMLGAHLVEVEHYSYRRTLEKCIRRLGN